MTIKWLGANSNNFQVGRSGNKIDKVVLHWIVGKLSAADATFQNPERIASAHYGIGHTEVHQYVREEDTAYHAGNLTINRQSIGIEHEGGPDLPISEDTHKTSIELVTDICRRYSIPADRQHIIKHSEVPRATQCPGTLDIDRIVREVQKRLSTPSDAPTDTISVPKKDFEKLVRNSDQRDRVWDYLKLDRENDNHHKVISAFENLKGELLTIKKSQETVEAENTTLRKKIDTLLQNGVFSNSTGTGSNISFEQPIGPSPVPDVQPDSDNGGSSLPFPPTPSEVFWTRIVEFIKNLFKKAG